MELVIAIVVSLIVGAWIGAKHQQSVFAAEKVAEEEAKAVYDAARTRIAKSRAAKAKATESAAPK